jgi:cell division protein FtsA
MLPVKKLFMFYLKNLKLMVNWNQRAYRMYGGRLESSFHVVVGGIHKKCRRCIQSSGWIVRLTLNPRSTSEVLSQEEKRRELALVWYWWRNYGFIIWRNHSSYCSNSFGGNVIDDIKEGCSIIEKQAELKVKFGLSLPRKIEITKLFLFQDWEEESERNFF